MSAPARLNQLRLEDSRLANVEAEAAFLGAALIDNAVLDLAARRLEPADFVEPAHRRIFDQAVRCRSNGAAVTALTLKPHLEFDAELAEIGGMAYVARLTGDGVGLLAAPQLADQIADLAERRRRLGWLEKARAELEDLSSPLGELTPPELDRRGNALPCLDLKSLASTEPKPKAFVIPRLAPAGEVTLFTGAGAVGKSLLAQQLATAVAAGVRTLGVEVERASTIYLTCEDDADQLHWRQAHLCRALGVGMAQLAGRLHLVTLRGQPDHFLASIDDAGRLRPTALFGRVATMLRSAGARLVFLDNVAHLFPGDENARGEVTQFINLLNRLASENNAAIVLLGHPNKGGDTYSGSTAWLNAVRSQVTMERPKGSEHDPDLRSVSVGKPNYARAGEALRCRWSDWAFIRDEDLPEDEREQLADVIAAGSENAAFLDCLRARGGQGEARSVGPRPGPSYAPSQFESMPQARGHDRHALKRAMERLVSIGKIEFIEIENKAKGRKITIIREVKTGGFTTSPNSSPNSSRTLIPDSPELVPNSPRTVPEHSPLPTGGVGGAPLEGPHTPPRPREASMLSTDRILQ